MKPIDRINAAIRQTPREKLGYMLGEATRSGAAISFGDLLTDLAPFIEAEIGRAMKDDSHWQIGMKDEKAGLGVPRLHVAPFCNCDKPGPHRWGAQGCAHEGQPVDLQHVHVTMAAQDV